MNSDYFALDHCTNFLSLTEYLDAIERCTGFKGDAAILLLTWAIAAYRFESEMGVR
jgi:hypothetical protein